MSKRTVYDCDKCGEQELGDDGHSFSVHNGQRYLDYDRHRDDFIRVDVCRSCLADAFIELFLPDSDSGGRKSAPSVEKNVTKRSHDFYKWIKREK